MNHLILASRPQVTITLECYQKQYDAIDILMMRSFDNDELVALQEERMLLFTLITQAQTVLKSMED